MSIFESIKQERKLSMNHWRYRLLHWCFNVKDTSDPLDTGLPKYLYTHYCPLFHITNLIAILAPFILFFKILYVLFTYSGQVWTYLANFLVNTIAHICDKLAELTKSNTQKSKSATESVWTRANEVDYILRYIREWPSWNFEAFWPSYSYKFSILSESEVKAVYENYQKQIIEARERKEKRDARRKELWLFWINFSGVFVKWIINITYVGLAVLMVYGLYLFTMPVINFFVWAIGGIWSLNPLTFILYSFKWFMIGIATFAVAYGIIKVMSSERFLNILRIVAKVFPPSTLIVPVVTAPFVYAGKGISNTCEFVSMFYAENCPPITIISEEEAIIEKDIN